MRLEYQQRHRAAESQDFGKNVAKNYKTKFMAITEIYYKMTLPF